jgi:hypothetical protein
LFFLFFTTNNTANPTIITANAPPPTTQPVGKLLLAFEPGILELPVSVILLNCSNFCSLSFSRISF